MRIVQFQFIQYANLAHFPPHVYSESINGNDSLKENPGHSSYDFITSSLLCRQSTEHSGILKSIESYSVKLEVDRRACYLVMRKYSRRQGHAEDIRSHDESGRIFNSFRMIPSSNAEPNTKSTFRHYFPTHSNLYRLLKLDGWVCPSLISSDKHSDFSAPHPGDTGSHKPDIITGCLTSDARTYPILLCIPRSILN